MLVSFERNENKLRGQRDDLILEGSGKAKDKARDKGIQADKHQKNAVLAAEVGQKIIDNVGKNSETVSSILDSWSADRVR